MISVIVPVYNTENKLKKCIESILNQTYTDIELILVDDGSTDLSLDICRDFEMKDKRVRVYSQKNSGVSVARSLGLDMATGEYVGFIDSDDYIESCMFENLVEFMHEGYDFAACGHVCETEEGVTQEATSGNIRSLNSLEEILICMFSPDGCGPNVCNKLFRRDIIEKFDIRFSKEYVIGEDMIWLYIYVDNCHKGIYDPIHYYHYVTRKDSAYHRRFTDKKAQSSFISEIKSHEDIMLMLSQHGKKVKNIFLIKMYNVYLRALMFIEKENDNIYKSALNFIRKNLIKYIMLSGISFKQKAHAIFMSVCPYLYRNLLNKRRKTA